MPVNKYKAGEEEFWTGEYWTDGKPIYKRVYRNKTNGTLITIPEIETVTNLYWGENLSTTDSASYFLFGYDTHNRSMVEFKNGQFSVLLTNRAGQAMNVITIEYTKTTDTGTEKWIPCSESEKYIIKQ